MTEQYRIDEARRVVQLMTYEGWQDIEKYVDEKIAFQVARLSANESVVEVAAVDKQGDNITVVVLNKDAAQHELRFWRMLKAKFNDWRKIARENING